MVAQEGFVHPNMYLNAAEIEAIRAKVRDAGDPVWRETQEALLRKCEGLLALESQPVSGQYQRVKPPLLGEPPPAGPDGGPTHYERAIRDCYAARDLGLAYALTGDERYAQKVLAFGQAWAEKMEPTWPDDYQSMREITRTLPALFYGVDLAWNSPSFNPEARKAIQDWAGTLAKNLAQIHVLATPDITGWDLNLFLAVGVVAEDRQWLDFVYNSNTNPDTFQRLLPQLFNSEGELVFESRGPDQLQRSMQSLKSFVYTAEIALHQGVDLYNLEIDGRSLKKSLLHFAPFFTGEKKWPNLVPFRGWDQDACIYELAAHVWEDPAFRAVLKARGRKAYDWHILGPVSLTAPPPPAE